MKAIILAAGTGSRLKPLTDRSPKCLVPVLGEPMLIRCLKQLEHAGIRHAVIVVGYLADIVYSTIGEQFGKIKIEYVNNVDYATTNNIYSLYLARSKINDDILLIESDLIFDHQFFPDLVAYQADDTVVVDDYTAEMDGTVVFAQPNLLIDRFILKVNQGSDFDYTNALKTVNVYKFSKQFLEKLYMPKIEQWVQEQKTDQYYEAALAELVTQNKTHLKVFHMKNLKWAEIDNMDDLNRAENIFL